MMDQNLIKFVEPIGLGQIVDRSSLVAVAVGYVQVSIQNSTTEILVKVREARGMDSIALSNCMIKTYVWHNGQVFAGEEIVEESDENRNRTLKNKYSTKRRSSSGGAFRFKKHHCMESDVDGILQICVFTLTSGTIHRKNFLGTVHIALKCLTEDNDCLVAKEDSYKVFPESAFLPGNPSDIAKSDCYISGLKEEEEVDEIFLNEEPEVTPNRVPKSSSMVNFSQFRLQHTRLPSIFTSPGSRLSRRRTIRESVESRALAKTAIAKWLRRQNSVDEENAKSLKSRRLTVDVGSPTPSLSSSAPPCPFLVGSTKFGSTEPFPTLSRPNSCQEQRSYSTTSSSTDAGYESSLSGSSTSDESPGEKAGKKYKLRFGFGKAWSFKSLRQRGISEKSAPIDIPKACEKEPADNSQVSPKQRSKVLRRSYRISNSKTFTSLSEIGASGPSCKTATS